MHHPPYGDISKTFYLTHYSPVLLFYTPWKHHKTFRFSEVFKRHRKATLGCNGLIKNLFHLEIFRKSRKMMAIWNLGGFKSVRIPSFSGSYFLEIELNTEKYEMSLRIRSECIKIRTRKTPNTDTFHAAFSVLWNQFYFMNLLFCRIGKNF